MLVNPDIQEWFDKLQGHPLGVGGGGGVASPRPVSGLATGLTSGIVAPQRGMFGFNAPAIAARYQPQPAIPYAAGRGMMGQQMAPLGGGGGARDLGGGAIAAGLGKLGAGAESALKAIGDKNRARQADLAAAAGINAPGAFGTAPLPPDRPGAPLPPDRPGAPLPVPRPVPAPITPTFPPVGPASGTPSFAQGGAGATPIPPIGGGAASLPTLAQGAPAGSDLSTAAAQEAYIRSAASQRGIDPDVAVRVARSEGLGGNYIGDKGSSFGPYQLHYGGMAGGGNAVSGLGDEFSRTHPGMHASDPSTVGPQIDFALDQAAKGGWGPWHGAANVGIGRMQGIGGQAAGVAPSSPSSPSAAAYAAAPPVLTGPNAPQLAGATPTPNTPSPGAAPQIITPPSAPPIQAPGADQPGILHGNYKGQDYIYQAPAPVAPTAPSGAAGVPVPAPPGPPGGFPGQQGMNTTPQQPQGPGINPLAAALAGQGGLPPNMSQMDPGMLAMALSGGMPNLGGLGAMPAEIAPPPPPPMDFAAAAPMDFGGFGGFGGLFG